MNEDALVPYPSKRWIFYTMRNKLRDWLFNIKKMNMIEQGTKEEKTKVEEEEEKNEKEKTKEEKEKTKEEKENEEWKIKEKEDSTKEEDQANELEIPSDSNLQLENKLF